MSVCDDVDMSITNLSAVCKIITCFYKVNHVLIINTVVNKEVGLCLYRQFLSQTFYVVFSR